MSGPYVGGPVPSPVRAVVLLSGGLDSCTVAARAVQDGLDVHALSFDYAQRHRKELECARAVARRLGLREHKVLRLPLGELGGSSLTDGRLAVPDAPADERSIGERIPNTYVPARNTVFLAFALAYAETRGCAEVHIGANALDSSGYPDCRPEFLEAFETVARLGTKQGAEGAPLRIVAPLLRMNKADIVRAAVAAKAPLELTWSCYRGGDEACGRCESCVLRLRGFREAGVADPIAYEVAA
jgi:7-cyano-7-deazaguanine synthase